MSGSNGVRSTAVDIQEVVTGLWIFCTSMKDSTRTLAMQPASPYLKCKGSEHECERLGVHQIHHRQVPPESPPGPLCLTTTTSFDQFLRKLRFSEINSSTVMQFINGKQRFKHRPFHPRACPLWKYGNHLIICALILGKLHH